MCWDRFLLLSSHPEGIYNNDSSVLKERCIRKDADRKLKTELETLNSDFHFFRTVFSKQIHRENTQILNSAYF